MKTKEELLEALENIEKCALRIDVKEVVRAVERMSECSDLFATQMFLRGLAGNLDELGTQINMIWSKAYHTIKDAQPEAVEATEEVDTAPIEELEELEEVNG